MMYEMIYGKTPFFAPNHIQLVKIIERAGQLSLPKEPQFPSEAQDLLVKLLQKNRQERISFSDFFKHPFLTKSSLSNTQSVSSLLGTSTPRNIIGPSGLSLAMSRKNSSSSSPLSAATHLMMGSKMNSNNPSLLNSSTVSRFSKINQEEELIELIQVDFRKDLRYSFSLADVAIDNSGKLDDENQELLILIKALGMLVFSLEIVEKKSELEQLIIKKVQSIDRLIKRIFKNHNQTELDCVIELNVETLMFEYAHKLALEAGFKEFLGYNAWRVYNRAASLAESLKKGERLLNLLYERI